MTEYDNHFRIRSSFTIAILIFKRKNSVISIDKGLKPKDNHSVFRSSFARIPNGNMAVLGRMCTSL